MPRDGGGGCYPHRAAPNCLFYFASTRGTQITADLNAAVVLFFPGIFRILLVQCSQSQLEVRFHLGQKSGFENISFPFLYNLILLCST